MPAASSDNSQQLPTTPKQLPTKFASRMGGAQVCSFPRIFIWLSSILAKFALFCEGFHFFLISAGFFWSWKIFQASVPPEPKMFVDISFGGVTRAVIIQMNPPPMSKDH